MMQEDASFTISRCAPGQVPPDAFEAVYVLKADAFGPPTNDKDAEELAIKRSRGARWWVQGDWQVAERPVPLKAMYHLLYHQGGLGSIAQTSVRTIHTPRGELDVLTLVGVVSGPSLRGLGFGKAVILDAFSRLEEVGLTHCLFQTGDARGLYEKLGATLVVGNRFVDRTAQDTEASPWFDDCVMRYPKGAPWPDGLIDLNGPGY